MVTTLYAPAVNPPAHRFSLRVGFFFSFKQEDLDTYPESIQEAV